MDALRPTKKANTSQCCTQNNKLKTLMETAIIIMSKIDLRAIRKTSS